MNPTATDIKAFFYDCSSYSWLRTQETLQQARKRFDEFVVEKIPVRLIVTKHKLTDETEGFWIRLDSELLGENDILIDEYPKN